MGNNQVIGSTAVEIGPREIRDERSDDARGCHGHP